MIWKYKKYYDMKYGYEMGDPEMEGMKGWWVNLPEDKKKAVTKATFDFRLHKVCIKR
jgi:hypothetical protein